MRQSRLCLTWIINFVVAWAKLCIGEQEKGEGDVFEGKSK